MAKAVSAAAKMLAHAANVLEADQIIVNGQALNRAQAVALERAAVLARGSIEERRQASAIVRRIEGQLASAREAAAVEAFVANRVEAMADVTSGIAAEVIETATFVRDAHGAVMRHQGELVLKVERATRAKRVDGLDSLLKAGKVDALGHEDGMLYRKMVARAQASIGSSLNEPNGVRRMNSDGAVWSALERGYRYVDLAALILHRSGNVQSHAKRDAALPGTASIQAAEDETVENGGSSSSGISRAIQEANLRLKELQVRDAEREDQLAEGELVPAADVLSVVTMSLQAMISELERAEVSIAARHGRVVATDFRKSRKDAQAKAAEQLMRLAKKHLHPAVAGQLTAAPMPEAVDA